MQKWRAKLIRFAWLPALLVIFAFLIVDNVARWRDSERITRARSAEAPVPALDPNSPTGYAFGQRRLILVPYSVDGYQWLMQTQEVLAGKGLRVRFVEYDNAPAGREVHWSSGLIWWLAGLAEIDHWLTGRALPLALEHVAPLASPLLLAILLLALAPLLVRRFGALVAIVVLAGFVFCQPLYIAFVAGYIDHHGLAAGCALLSVLLLAGGGGGWRRNPTFAPNESAPSENLLADWLPDHRSARRWFVAAAVAGAAGLWISAASEAPILVGIGLGVLANAVWMRSSPRTNVPWQPDPTLWRLWGFAGAMASLFFYLLEYFPSHGSMRLEVNHPLYALSWLGAGDLLCRLCSRRPTEKAPDHFRAILAGVPGFLALAALPLVVLAARDRVFVVADPFLWALHADYIGEFQPYAQHLAQGSWKAFFFGLYHPVTALAGLCVLVLLPGVERPWKSLLILTAFPVVIALGLTLKQERWLILACAVAVAALAVVVLVASRSPALRWTKPRAAAGLGCLALVLLGHPLSSGFYFLHAHAGIPSQCQPYLTVRSLANTLRQRLGAEPGVIVGGFSATTEMIYFGGFRGLGTGYWENRNGLRAAVEILGADSDDTALGLIRKHGITHIVDASWDLYATPAFRLLHGLPKNEIPAPKGFLNRLEDGKFPTWVRPIIAVSDAQTAMVYEIDLRQTPLESLVHNARFFVEASQDARAEAFLKQALAVDPDNAPALALRARLQAAQGDHAGLAASLSHLQKVLDQHPRLEADDRLDLATAWLAAGNETAARSQVAATLAATSERELRRLDPRQLRRLLDLAGRWTLPYPAGLSAEFATGLLPKILRPEAAPR